MHNNGEGLEQDPVNAYKWISLAAADAPQEFADSYRWVRADLEKSLPPEIVDKGRQLAGEWRPKAWAELKTGLE